MRLLDLISDVINIEHIVRIGYISDIKTVDDGKPDFGYIKMSDGHIIETDYKISDLIHIIEGLQE